MRHRRTQRKALAAAAAALLVLSACSSAPDPDSGATDPGAAADPSSLTVWIMGDNRANLETVVEPFVAETGIEIDVQAIPWESLNDRLTTAVASGQGPDVTQVGLSHLASFIEAGALADLSDHLGDYPNLDPANFPDAVAPERLNPEGGIHSVPWVSDTRVLFSRTDILAENGIDSPPSTWEGLRAAAQTLAARGDGQFGYYIPQWDEPLPVAYTWQAGGDVIAADGTIDLDTAAFRAAVDHYLGFYEDGTVPTAGDFDQAAGFISGAAPMLVSGPYLATAIAEQAPELDGSWTVTPVPAKASSTSLFAGSNLGVWDGSDNVDAALQLLDFLADPATQVTWYELTGELPTATAAFDAPALAEDPHVAVYGEQLQDARPLPISTAWDEASLSVLDTLNAVALTGVDKEQALEALFAKVEEINAR